MDTTQNLINALTPFWSTVDWGLVFAAIGFALVVILPGIGSALGVHLVGCTGAGVLSEDPSRFGKILLLQVLPGTQGIYGLLIGFIFLLKLGVMGGSLITPTRQRACGCCSPRCPWPLWACGAPCIRAVWPRQAPCW